MIDILKDTEDGLICLNTLMSAPESSLGTIVVMESKGLELSCSHAWS